MKKLLCIMASLMMLSTVMALLVIDDKDSSADGYMTEFPTDDVGIRITYNNASLDNVSQYGRMGYESTLDTCLPTTVCRDIDADYSSTSATGYFDLYMDDRESGDCYSEAMIYHIKLKGTAIATFPSGDSGYILMATTDEEWAVVEEKVTALFTALGHSDNSEVDGDISVELAYDFDLYYRSYREYSKTPVEEEGVKKWNILNETTDTKFKMSTTAVLSMNFTDTTSGEIEVKVDYSLTDASETNQSTTGDLVKRTQDITKSTIVKVGEVSKSFPFDYEFGPESNHEGGDVDLKEEFEERDKSLPKGTGFETTQIDRNTMITGLSESGLLDTDKFLFRVDYYDGEKKVLSQDYLYNETIVLPESVTKAGYRLSEWTGYTKDMKMPAKDIDLKADWVKSVTADQIKEDGKTIKVVSDGERMAVDTAVLNDILSKSESSGSKINLSLSEAKITMSADALKKLSKDSSGNVMDMQISVSTATKLDESMESKVKDNGLSTDDIAIVVSIDIQSSGQKDNLGKVEVSIPFADAENGKTYSVYYVDNDGNYVLMKNSKVVTDSEGKTSIVFETDHFSCFVVKPGDSETSKYLVPGLIGVIGALCLVSILLFIRKK